jgi:hypothetical protein
MESARAELTQPPEAVYLTGGMSRSPYVPQLVREMFPDAELVMGNASKDQDTHFLAIFHFPDAMELPSRM